MIDLHLSLGGDKAIATAVDAETLARREAAVAVSPALRLCQPSMSKVTLTVAVKLSLPAAKSPAMAAPSIRFSTAFL